MILSIVLLVFACVTAEVLVEPKFQVLTPNELMVELPHYEDKKLVTFRIGVRRAGRDEDDLELGENDVDNSRLFIHDQRLKLKEGDVVNYLLAFRDKRGYQAQSGNYYFNGVYYKKPSGRRLRFRRDLIFTTEADVEDSTDGEVNVESRFGGGYHRRRYHGWHHNHRPDDFQDFGPPRHPFPLNSPPPFGPPNFDGGCNDNERCYGRDNRRWMSTSVPPDFATPNVEYHCRICNSQKREVEVTASPTTTRTGEDSPDIDIRFSD